MAGKPDNGGGDLPYLYGEDGWPLGGPSDAEVASADERFFQRDMQAARARWESDGDLTAVAAAFRLCWQHRQPPPHWLVEAGAELVTRAMAEEEKRARREWRIHWTRWEALVELRERRHELQQRGDDRGTSWERAREAVSDILRKTEAAGSARAVRESYEIVEAAGGAQATYESFLAERARREQHKRQRHGEPEK